MARHLLNQAIRSGGSKAVATPEFALRQTMAAVGVAHKRTCRKERLAARLQQMEGRMKRGARVVPFAPASTPR